jgi:hypothetical protein
MQLDTVLDIAIGLGFTYFLLASMVSFIQEQIASVFKWRGTYLVKAIDVILSNDPAEKFAWGKDWLHAHIRPSAPPSRLAANGANGTDAEQAANYGPNSAPSAASIAAAVRTHPLLRNAKTAAQATSAPALPSYITGANFATALLTALRDGSQNPVIQQAGNTVNALPNGDLKDILSGLINDAAGDLDKLRAGIEGWFDTEMDKLSGIYQSMAQYVSLIIGAVITLVLKADTLHLVGYLWIDDPVQRAAIIDNVSKTVNASGATAQTLGTNITSAVKTLEGFGLPIGWGVFSGSTFSVVGAYLSAMFHGVISMNTSMFIGLALTTIATALGAPFWFDLVQNITNLRSGTPKPGSSS